MGVQESHQLLWNAKKLTLCHRNNQVGIKIATDRSDNEWAVAPCKRSGYVKRGLQYNGSPVRLDNAWLAKSFQVNFMYEPVV